MMNGKMELLARLKERMVGGAVDSSDTEVPFIPPVTEKKMKIIAVGGGKGGVGKSLISANFGAGLADNGKRILLVDADFGAANLHTFVKAKKGKVSMSSFMLTGDVDNISDVISETSIDNLHLMGGASDSLDVANFGSDRIDNIWNALPHLDYDCVILDIGPGTSSANIDVFLKADYGILVTTPEPTSVENTYRFLKCLYSSKIRKMVISESDDIRKFLKEKLFEDGRPKSMTIAQIIKLLIESDSDLGARVKEILSEHNMYFLVNQVSRESDAGLGEVMKTACSHYFGLDIGYLGSVSFDGKVHDSIRNGEPVSLFWKDSESGAQIMKALSNFVKDINTRGDS